MDGKLELLYIFWLISFHTPILPSFILLSSCYCDLNLLNDFLFFNSSHFLTRCCLLNASDADHDDYKKTFCCCFVRLQSFYNISSLIQSTDTSYERKLMIFLCLLFFSRFSFDMYWKNIERTSWILISILFPFSFLSIFFSIKQTQASCYFSL